MIDIFKAVILGIIEGITEFLPISSTGHLIIVNEYIYFSEDFTKMFDVVIQLGAILAVVVLYWNDLFPFGKKKSKEKKIEIWNTWFKTVAGVIPTIIIAFIFKDIIDQYLFNTNIVAIMLIIGGLVLIAVERKTKNAKIKTISELTYKTAFLIGIIQCLGMIPGTSRSAATIIGAMLLGASRVVAAEFSFFLAIPTMVAASAYMLFKSGLSMTGEEAIVLSVGFIVSFIVAWIVIKGFMSFIKKRDFIPFAYYRIVLGIIVILYAFIISTNIENETNNYAGVNTNNIEIEQSEIEGLTSISENADEA